MSAPRRSTSAAKSRDKNLPTAKDVRGIIPQQPLSILAVIAKAASDPNVIPEKMRALLDMQKEILAEEARMAFTRDFIAMSEKLPIIDALGRIEIKEKIGGERKGPVQQSTPYATYNEIWKAIKPILQQFHFGLSHANEQATDEIGRVVVRTTLMHESGHERQSVIPLPLETSGSKNNVQGYGSSTSYGKRYNTIQLLNLISEAPEDRDTDGVTMINQTQLEELIAQADEVGADKKRFCETMQIPSMNVLPLSRLEEAKALLRLKGRIGKKKEPEAASD